MIDELHDGGSVTTQQLGDIRLAHRTPAVQKPEQPEVTRSEAVRSGDLTEAIDQKQGRLDQAERKVVFELGWQA